MPIPHNSVYTFGEFRLDAGRRRLWRSGEAVAVSSKVLDLLLVFVREQGRVFSKEELMQQVWPDATVEESNLAVSVSTLRRALGEKSGENRFIATVPGHGYQFVAQVQAEETSQDVSWYGTGSVSDLRLDQSPVSEKPGRLRSPYRTDAVRTDSEEPGMVTILLEAPANELLLPTTLPSTRRRTFFFTLCGALTLAVLLGAVWWLKRDSVHKQANEIRSLAVLPFKSLTGADSDQTLGLGLADALITHLSSTGQWMVRPTSAIWKYTAPDANLAKIGAELDVEAVLDGRIQQSEGRLRLTVQLVRAADDAPLWAESFDEEFTNLLTVQKTISEQVARLLMLKLTVEQEQRLARNYTANTEAFQAYLRGRNFEFQRRPEQLLQQAVKEYERAIALDPAYALAYTGISDCYFRLSLPPFMMGEPPEPAPFAKARAAALKAVELDPGLSDAHASLGAILAYENDAACHRAYERALELNPHNPRAYQYYALHLFADNRPQDAFEELQRAVAIDPLSAQLNSALGVTLYRLGRYDEAIAKLKQTEKLDPNFFRTYWGLGLAYAQAGQNEAAVAAFQRAVELTNNGPLMLGALAFGYAKAGRRAEAEQTLARIEQVQPPKRGTAYWVAAAYVGLGEPDRAFEWLEKARQEGANRLILIEPIFDSLRADPRYATLLGE